MTVLQIMPGYYPATVYGGPIFSMHYTCQALARQGVPIHVVTTNANGSSKLVVPTDRVVEFETNYRVRYYDDTIVGRFSWPLTRNLKGDIATADIVHLQDVYSVCAVWTLLLAKLLAKPVLISPRGSLSPWGLATKRPLLKKAFLSMVIGPLTGNARRVAWHATADSERDEIRCVFPASQVHVVPNAIDCAVFDDAPRLSRADYLAKFFPRCSVAAEDVTILAGMGRLHAKKSLELAILALHAVADTHPEALLLIAGGDGGERARLSSVVRNLRLEDRVAFLGELTGPDKIAFLKGADLFLFPSHSENFGMACLEAMAAGLPVVASRNTPWAEVESIGSGVWVENTAEAFAAATADLLSRDLSEMRRKAQTHARQYDLSAIAMTLRQIYLELINANGP